VLKALDHVEIDAVQDDLGRVETAEPLCHGPVDDLVVGDS
jgi:hypothetical protein